MWRVVVSTFFCDDDGGMIKDGAIFDAFKELITPCIIAQDIYCVVDV